MLKRRLVDVAFWYKALELLYAGLIGFEVGFILDLMRQLR